MRVVPRLPALRVVSAPVVSAPVVSAVVFLLAAFLLPALPAHALVCGWDASKTPSEAPPPSLWNGLKPVAENGLPSNRDTTFFDRNSGWSHSKPIWRSIDVENGWVIAGYTRGVQFWDATGARAANPVIEGSYKVESLPVKNLNPHDYFLVTDVDAPAGSSNLAVFSGWDNIGIAVLDVSNKAQPKLLYQDGGSATNQKYGEGVYATRIDGRYYGFLGAGRNSEGLWIYDLTTAQQVGAGGACSEARPGTVNPACNGVFKKKLDNIKEVRHIDGAGDDASGHFIAFNGPPFVPVGLPGLQIWEVTNPSAPTPALTGFTGRRVDGVAMWEDAGKLYLAAALRGPDVAAIYDVTCVKNGCGANPLAQPPLYSFGTGPTVGGVMSATYSEGNGTPYLYIGRKQSYGSLALQGEWLLDVSDPSNPAEVTGGDPLNGNQPQATVSVGGDTVGYWSWYYECYASGSNSLEPAGGLAYGGYFYRAGGGILDVHQFQNVDPRIVVSANPDTVYEGVPTTATATAFNCSNPSPTGWSFTAAGAQIQPPGIGGSSRQITWTTPGSKTVRADNTGCSLPDHQDASVTVLDASPTVGTVVANVSTAPVCSQITFTANSVGGKPPVVLSWEILDPTNPLPAPALTPSGNTVVWNTTGVAAPGTYRARVTVSANSENVQGTSANFSLTALQPVPAAGGFAPTNDAFLNATVQFHVNVPEATEWNWDFGDGAGYTGWTSNAQTGPNPQHTYATIGVKNVKVMVRNCLGPEEPESAVLLVDIIQVTPLTAGFNATGCFFGICAFDVNEQITFVDSSTGAQFWDYDWDGNGSFEDANNASPRTTHTYSQAGLFTPVLRVRRGTEPPELFTHAKPITISSVQQQNPSISVGGPTSGKVNTTYTYSASFQNCTPASTWNWSASGGGSVSGTGTSVQVSWSTVGTKSVTATNAGCSGASGQRSVSITTDDPDPEPGDLEAAFVFSPSSPTAGQAVSFDGSSSTGSPTSYSWIFGDGGTASGAQASHTFAAAGSYQVKLEVGKAGTSCGFGICSDTVTKVVTVQPSGPVVGANGCTGDLSDQADTLCLGPEGRWQVDVDWHDHHNDRDGVGNAQAHTDGTTTGFFTFFNKKNIELIVKIIDGTNNNSHIWVFYGGLSDVYYKLRVTDTHTSQTKEYENLPGSICGRGDTAAFKVVAGDATAAPAATPAWAPVTVPRSVDAPFRPDLGDPDALYLLGGRFKVNVDWMNHHAPGNPTGVGHAVDGSDASGYFWFFNQINLELVVKMIDARSFDGSFWVFWGGLSDVQYEVEVEDLETGDTWQHTNPPGSICGGADTAAFEPLAG